MRSGNLGRDTCRSLAICCFVAAMASGALSAPKRMKVTVLTTRGEVIEGGFRSANETHVFLDINGAAVSFALNELSYVSFVGLLPLTGGALYERSAEPSEGSGQAATIRLAAAALEQSGRSDQALAKYEEALRLDPTNETTLSAVDRLRARIRVRDAGLKAQPLKKLVKQLRDARRYAEASACYDQAVEMDPYDEAFRDSLASMRDFWQPSTCPAPK